MFSIVIDTFCYAIFGCASILWLSLSLCVSVICDIYLFLAMTKGEKTYGYSVYVYSLIFFVDICLMQGKTSEHIHICYTCSLQGEFLCAQLVTSKRGRML